MRRLGAGLIGAALLGGVGVLASGLFASGPVASSAAAGVGLAGSSRSAVNSGGVSYLPISIPYLYSDGGAQFFLGADGGCTLRGALSGDPYVANALGTIGTPTLVCANAVNNAPGPLNGYGDFVIWPHANDADGRLVVAGDFEHNGEGFGEMVAWDVDIVSITNIAAGFHNMDTNNNGTPNFEYGLSVDGGNINLSPSTIIDATIDCFAGACIPGEYATLWQGVTFTSDVSNLLARFFEPLRGTSLIADTNGAAITGGTVTDTLKVGSGPFVTNVAPSSCTLSGGLTCTATTPGTTSASTCTATAQGGIAVACSTTPGAGSTLVTCASVGTEKVAVHCDN